MISKEKIEVWLMNIIPCCFQLGFSLPEIVQLNGFESHEICWIRKHLGWWTSVERTFSGSTIQETMFKAMLFACSRSRERLAYCKTRDVGQGGRSLSRRDISSGKVQ